MERSISMNENHGFTNENIYQDELKIINLNSVLLKKEPPQLDFIITGLPRASVGLLIGKGGIGKSMFVIQLIRDLVTQQSLLGLNQVKKRRKVTYLSLEDSEDIIKARFHNVLASSSSDQIDSIIKYSRIITPTSQMALSTDDSHEYNKLYFAAWESDLLIIDTLSRLHVVEENSNSDMAAILGMLNRIAKDCNCAILVIHHIAKSTHPLQNNRYSASETARGASAITDNARFVMRLSRSEKNEIILDFDKFNYISKREPIYYSQNEMGILELKKKCAKITPKQEQNNVNDNEIEKEDKWV
jgi:RecA-family ATPase